MQILLRIPMMYFILVYVVWKCPKTRFEDITSSFFMHISVIWWAKMRYRFEIRHMDYLHVCVQNVFRFIEKFEKFRCYI